MATSVIAENHETTTAHLYSKSKRKHKTDFSIVINMTSDGSKKLSLFDPLARVNREDMQGLESHWDQPMA